MPVSYSYSDRVRPVHYTENEGAFHGDRSVFSGVKRTQEKVLQFSSERSDRTREFHYSLVSGNQFEARDAATFASQPWYDQVTLTGRSCQKNTVQLA